MKLTVRHLHMRSTAVIDSLVERRILALEPRLHIDEANVALEHRANSSPPFRVHVHLVTPGPDVLAESLDHTIRAAIDKAVAQLEDKIKQRSNKRPRRIKSNLQAPVTSRTPRQQSRATVLS